MPETVHGGITCATIDGNKNLIATRRPITTFKRLVFGERDIENKNNYHMITTMPIDVYLHLRNDLDNDLFDSEQLMIETDQNLQKYFLVESDEETLRIKLDSYEDKYLLERKRLYQLSSNSLLSGNVVKNGINFVNTTRTRITIRTRQSSLFINKHNFGKLNIYVQPPPPHQQQLRQQYMVSNSTINLNCNGSIQFDGILVDDIHKFSNSMMASQLSIFVCDESFNLYVSQTRGGLSEFVASKEKDSFRQLVNEITNKQQQQRMQQKRQRFTRVKLNKFI